MRVLAAVTAALLGACGPTITITDSIDLTWDLEFTLNRFEDNLHDPYVRGATMRMYVTSDDEDQRFEGWSISPIESELLMISEPTYDGTSLTAEVTALEAGDVTVQIIDERGEIQGETVARIRVPDEIQLDAHGYLIIGQETRAPVDDLRIVDGGTATYLVNYFADGEQLFGNGVLSGAGPGLTVENQTTYFFEDREWLTVSANAAGTQNLDLLVDGEVVDTRVVNTVPELDITQVEILGKDEGRAQDGEWMVLLAQSYDSMGRRIFGVDYEWNVGGEQELGVGDLYRYEFARGSTMMAVATRAGISDQVEIQSGGGFVDSTNNVGCSTTTPAGWLMPLGALAAVALSGTRARRRRALRRAAAAS